MSQKDLLAELAEWSEVQNILAQKHQEILQLFAEKMRVINDKNIDADPMGLHKSVRDFWAEFMHDPEKAVNAQIELARDHMDLMHYTMNRLANKPVAEPVIPSGQQDRRFRDKRWMENPLFDHLRQSYLLNVNWMNRQLDAFAQQQDKDPQAIRKMRFALRQYLDAMAPSNFWLTNPEVLDEILNSKGKNLLQGMDNLIADLKSNAELPKISMVKSGVFEVGKNLATTKGKVVFQNELLQIIQYSPTTKTVYKTPLVIISPWINKFYILDMQAENSFVKWAVDQGHTVFITSWVNADHRHKDITFYDYMDKGLMAAIKTAQQATGEKDVNIIGYCIGGTLLAATLAYWKAKKIKAPVKSATFFTALIDFEDAGELTLFTDEAQISMIEKLMEEKGYLDGWHLATTFNMLRANDLIWSFVINNYLLGREPMPFDLLYWNSDSTSIPAKAHSFYLREMYQKNHLAQSKKLVLNGTALDVCDIDTPSYFISTIDDHIAPWKATYNGAKLLAKNKKGDVTFTLAGSGHIAGIVNPPVKNKYGYWTYDALPSSPDTWLNKAEQHDGSWWPHWAKWVAKHAGKKVPARLIGKGNVGKGKLKPIEDAPGSYVKKRG